jgi:hypothetical protein
MTRKRLAPLLVLTMVAAAGACTGRSTYKGGGRAGELPQVDEDTAPVPTTRDASVRDTGARDTGSTQDTFTLPDTAAE